MIIYPDKVLEWLNERTGRELGWLHLILIEVGAIVMMVIAMTFLMPVYPKLSWLHPLLYVSAVGVVRGISWFIKDMLGFDD